jgi:hypothetical protein
MGFRKSPKSSENPPWGSESPHLPFNFVNCPRVKKIEKKERLKPIHSPHLTIIFNSLSLGGVQNFGNPENLPLFIHKS